MKKMSNIILAVSMIFMLVSIAQADPINLALTGTATQSSTYSWHINLGADNAIDGNTSGDAFTGSVTHTNEEYQPWWQVDLGSTYDLDQIVIWNRIPDRTGNVGIGSRLSNFNVSVFDNQNQTVWTNDFFTTIGYPDPILTINLPENTVGEIVRVRLNGTNFLSLAEVQVFRVPEPATMLLLGLGLLGLAAARRKV